MSLVTIVCARCATGNHPSDRFRVGCELPLGAPSPGVGTGLDALGPCEAPDPAEAGAIESALRRLIARAGFDASPFRHGWRLVVPLELDRQQAASVGPAGTDSVVRNIATDEITHLDAALVRRMAPLADGLEDRLSRGRDLY